MTVSTSDTDDGGGDDDGDGDDDVKAEIVMSLHRMVMVMMTSRQKLL